MKRTLKKILSAVLCVVILITSIFCMGFVSAETNVNYLMENGKRIGIKDVTIDGVTYYDIDGGRSTIDPDSITAVEFFKKAMLSDYNGYSAIDMWANIASQIFESAGSGIGYNTRKDFDTNLVEGFSNEGSFSGERIVTTGWLVGNSLKTAQDKMVSEFVREYGTSVETDDFIKCATGKETGFDLLNDDTAQTVLYNIASNGTSGSANYRRYYQGYGIAFYDFKVTPLTDDDLEFITAAEGYKSLEDAKADNVSGVEYISVGNGVSHTSYITNPSASSTNVSNSYSETFSTAVSNHMESTETYSFGQSIEVSTELGDSLPVTTSISAGLSAEETISTAYGTEESVTRERTMETATEVSLPAHTKIGVSQQDGSVEAKLDYDCPVYITYKVAIFGMNAVFYWNNITGTDNWTTADLEQGSICVGFGSDSSEGGVSAVDNIFNRAIKFKDMSGYDESYGNNFGRYKYHGDGKDPATYTAVDWNEFIDSKADGSNVTTRKCIEHLKYNIPLSSSGATLTINSSSITTDISGIYPLYNLDNVKLVDDAIYNLEAGNSLDLGRIATAGYNAYNVPYYGYVSDGGEWALCDENGNALSSVDGASLANISGTQILNTEKEGTYYLKFLIDENLYTDVDDDDVTIKNADLSSSPVIVVKATQAADGSHKCVAGDWKTSFPATCSAEGEKCNYCITCGKLMEVQAVAKLAHTEVETVTPATCQSEGSAKTVCGSCSTVISSRVIPKTEHTLGVWAVVSNATCTADGEKQQCCSSCGNVINSEIIPAHGHSDGGWKVDFEATADHNGQMSRYCTTCNAALETKEFTTHTHEFGYESIIREATCKENGEKGLFCKVCNAMYATEQIEKSGHGENIAVKSILPTCTTAGEEKLYCADCGALTGTNEIPAKGHGETYEAVASEATADRNGIIETRCKDCDAVISTEEFELHSHEFGYESIIREATCTENGEKGLFCKVCNAMYSTEQIEKHGHGANIAVTSIQPTCTTAGEEKLHCADCGALTGANEIPALGHDDGVWSVSIKATCEDKGEEICKCTRCGEEIDSRATDAMGHDSGVWKIDFEATADHEGQMTKYCTRCDMSLESKIFELHTHSEGYKGIVTPATCTTEGEGGIFCASCGVQYGSYAIDSLGHDYSAWHKNNNGTHSRSCSRCGNTEINNCAYTSTVTAPTCTEGGMTTHVCDICAYSYVDAYTAALGHDWGAYTACDDSENHSRACEECAATETSAHNWSEWSYNDDSTLVDNGTQTRECADCGETETETAEHTSWICEIFYPVIVFIGNIVHKLIYIVSLNWLFPELTITA